MKIRILTGALILSMVVGCNDDDDDNDKVGQVIEQFDQSLTGDWQTPCLQNEWNGLIAAKDELTFSAIGDFEKELLRYSDDQCETPIFSIKLNGTYASLDKNQAAQDARNINFTITKAELEVNNPQAVDLLNRLEYCGIRNWQVGQSRDILGKDCLGPDINQGSVIFDIYNVENNKLFLGDALVLENIGNAENRPTQLNSSRIYQKE